MGDSPRSSNFTFESRQSENDFTQSWVGVNNATGSKCFLKLPTESGSLKKAEIRKILARAYQLQSHIRSSKVLTAVASYADKDTLTIEYPYLNAETWQPLTPELFCRYTLPVLKQVAVIVDYLHLLDLVHCDLKLENFQINTCGRIPDVKLVDLDCLAREGTSPEARIMGTPGYLPPEVIQAEAFTLQSDNFALGRSIANFIDGRTDETDASVTARGTGRKLRNLVTALTSAHPTNRPSFLLKALGKAGLIGAEESKALETELLAMLLTGAFRQFKSELLHDTGVVERILHREVRLLGLPEELIRSLEAAFPKAPLQTSKLFESIVADSEIKRQGDYWHIAIEDEVLLQTFDALAEIVGTNADSDADDDTHHEYLRRKLAYSVTVGAGPSADRLPDIKYLVDTALDLNRGNDAFEFLTEGLKLEGLAPQDEVGFLFKAILQLLRDGRNDECDPLIERGIAAARSMGDLSSELDFRRQSAWLHTSRGNHIDAKQVLRDVVTIAGDKDLSTQLAKGHSDLNLVEWNEGNFTAAEEHLHQAVSIAEETEQTGLLGNLYIRSSNLYYNLSQYKRAAKFGKQAMKHLGSHDMFFAHRCVAVTHGRLAEYKKADYWYNQFLTSVRRSSRPDLIVDYYNDLSWLNMNRGDLVKAKESAFKALGSLSDSTVRRVEGRIYHNLAEIALYQGESSLCRRYLKSAGAVFQKIKDNYALTEVEFIRQLSSHTLSRPLSADHLLAQLDVLVENHCNYYALMCLYYCLLTDDQSIERTLEETSTLTEVIDMAEIPLSRAVGIMIRARLNKDGSVNVVRAMKSAFAVLQSSGQKYLCLLTCHRISQQYERESKTKLAAKFLDQARMIADSIGNEGAREFIDGELSRLSTERNDRSSAIQAFLGITRILRDIDDYDKATREVVQFAVSETGAERGVFLVRSRQSENLTVRAFVNCDDDSLDEIAGFSKTLSGRASEGADPLVIKDALKNKSTKGLKSIVAHNIRSVMCIPVQLGRDSSGVLYLDHHTVPALFEEDDVAFVVALSNSMSVLFKTIKRFKDADIGRRTLASDLANSGVTSPMVTQNETMKTLLASIPRIASSTAGILVTGESGTGKEILCQMIHDKSPRKDRPLVKVNCAAIASTLIESELFGIAKNVATSVDAREGKFEAADGGTLFLDEIGDLSLEVQAKLLRVLELQAFERVGSNRTIYTDVRFIYATNKDLWQLVDEGKFRKDLLYRINTILIVIPPLRDRPDDVEPLIAHFSRLFASQVAQQPQFSQDALSALISYEWPGNVRELRNFVERTCILQQGQTITKADLPESILSGKSRGSRARVAETAERSRIVKALKENDWVQSRAADSLPMALTTFRRKIKKYGISRGE